MPLSLGKISLLGRPRAKSRLGLEFEARIRLVERSQTFSFAADFLVYLLVALQLRYFTRNPVKRGTPDQTNGVIVNLYKYQYWVDYCKVCNVAVYLVY